MDRRPQVRRALAVAAGASAGVLVLLTAVIGFAHTRAGRPLLAWLPGFHAARGGCPFGFDRAASPVEKRVAQVRFAAAHRGDLRSAARPALGFVLDQTTRAEVIAWAKAHDVSCTTPRSGFDLDCRDVPAMSLPTPTGDVELRSLWMGFDGAERLTAVVAVRRSTAAEPLSDAFNHAKRTLTEMAGAPASVEGDASPQAMSRSVLRQAVAEYRFADYYAVARAANMGDGYVLTEEYRSLL